MFPIKNGLKQGDALLLLLFNFAVECAIRRVHVNQNGLKLSGKNVFFNAADDNVGWKHTYYKGNKEALVVASEEIGLEVNGDKTKYLVMSQDQTAE